MSLQQLLTGFAKVLWWHLKRYYGTTTLHEGDRTFVDDGEASLCEMLRSEIDVSCVVPGLCPTLTDLLASPEACDRFCQDLHGPDAAGNPPLCFWWGDARTRDPEARGAKRPPQDKGALLRITLPLSLVWPLVRNSVSMEWPAKQTRTQPVWKLDVQTHQGHVLREHSGTPTDVLHMKVFDIAAGTNRQDLASFCELFQPLEWALFKWHARQDPH